MEIDRRNNNIENKKTGTIIKIGIFTTCATKTDITFPDGYTKDDFSKIFGYAIIDNRITVCEVSLLLEYSNTVSCSSYIEPNNTNSMVKTILEKDDNNVYCMMAATGGFSGYSIMEIYGVLK